MTPCDSALPSTAAILAGGLGTRLRSVVGEHQKVIAEVAGRPFLEHLLDDLAIQGIERVVVCTGYRGDAVRAALGDEYRGMELRWSLEPDRRGTAGALGLARRHLLEGAASGPILVLNGDSWCETDLEALAASHCQRDAAATLLLTEVEDASRFGRVEIEPGGRLREFREKGVGGRAWINAGVYCLSAEVLSELPADRQVSLEREVFPALLGDTDGGLFGYRGGGRFLDIGTPASYARADAFFDQQAGKSTRAPRRPGAAVLLDRDGTLNREVHYLSDPDRLDILPGVPRALRRLRDLGLGLVVVTNQSPIGRGLFDEATLESIHRRLRALLRDADVELDGIYHCPHRPDDGCRCRKPRTGLAERAGSDLDLEPSSCWVVGDKPSDHDMARSWGAPAFHVLTGHGRDTLDDVLGEPALGEDALGDDVVEDLWCAATRIERRLASPEVVKQESA